jgi:hypothetical protein
MPTDKSSKKSVRNGNIVIYLAFSRFLESPVGKHMGSIVSGVFSYSKRAHGRSWPDTRLLKSGPHIAPRPMPGKFFT